jgi:hypothetical protein
MLNESKLYLDVKGTCSGHFGYTIAVISIPDIGKAWFSLRRAKRSS